QMHEEGDHATKNQLSGSLLQGDGLEKRLEQWECILHDQHGRLLPQRLANGPLPHHYFAQIRRKEEAPPPFEPTHVEKAQLQNSMARMVIRLAPGASTTKADSGLAIRKLLPSKPPWESACSARRAACSGASSPSKAMTSRPRERI